MTTLTESNSKTSPKQPETLTLSVEERLEFLANIIVDRIMDDQASDQKLLKRILGEGNHDNRTIATA